jgi:hypothetical protein
MIALRDGRKLIGVLRAWDQVRYNSVNGSGDGVLVVNGGLWG